MLAGALTIGVGLFVLVARPNAALHRLFFVLALADGVGTASLALARMATDAPTRDLFAGAYWWFQIAFVTLLVVFGLLFPRPVASDRASRVLALAAGVAGTLALAYYARDHAAFWASRPPPAPSAFATMAGGNVVQIVFVAAIALLALKLTRTILAGPGAGHARQAAFVLGGMTLAYAPYATANVVRALPGDWSRTFLSPDLTVSGAYWAFAAATLALALIAWRLARDRDEEHAAARRFALAALGGVVALTALAVALPAASLTYVAQRLGLLAYPALLGYAIARFEVFDIDARLRRAATFTLAAGGVAVLFLVAETIVENALASTLAGVVPSSLVAGVLAAGAAALAATPIARASRRAMRKVIPDPSLDAVRQRKLELYRHGVEGALADGILAEKESRTLAVLRESLGITVEDHERVMAEVRGERRVVVA